MGLGPSREYSGFIVNRLDSSPSTQQEMYPQTERGTSKKRMDRVTGQSFKVGPSVYSLRHDVLSQYVLVFPSLLHWKLGPELLLKSTSLRRSSPRIPRPYRI